jgi:polysaccharide biosynthesis/export protein
MRLTSAGKTVCAYSLAFSLLTVMLTSCGSTRPYVYMQGQFDTAKLSRIPLINPIIHKGDLLSIIVYSDDPEATKIYNQPLIASQNSAASLNLGTSAGNADVTSSGSLGSSPTTPGYLVDENGNIDYQQFGHIHVEGLTRTQLKDTMIFKFKEGKLLTNPFCTVRFLNYRFTMLGEVNKPSIYSIPSDHVNIFEALSMAGDLTYYARRDNVLIIREQNGKREFGRIDLTKPDVLASPYFYLQQNDIVYFEQTKSKSVANDQVTLRNITIASAIISTLAIIYSILRN